MFEVAVENTFDFLSPDYATLFDASAATAFQHPVWLHALYQRLLSHNNASALIVVVRHSTDKSLAMVLPLVRRRYGALSVVEFADLRVSDYISPVASPGTFAAIAGDRAARHQIVAALKPYDLLRLGKLKDDAMPLSQLFGVQQAAAMSMSSYATTLDGSYEEWRDKRLKPSYRKELDKKLRQLHRKGEVRFERSTDPAEIGATFDALKIFRRDRFELNGGGELLQIPAYFDFYMAVAQHPDFARTYTLLVDGAPIAGVLGLAHKGSLLVILGGFIQTEFKNQSVGSLMFQEVARDSIARGDKLLDFTIGDEPYKLTFGAVPKPMWQISRAGSPLGLAAGVMVDRLPAVKTLARNIFHRAADKSTPERQSTSAAVADEERIERFS